MKNFYNLTDSKESKTSASLMGLGRGQSATIENIHSNCTGLVRRRLLDLGFVPGTKITKLGDGLFDGPSRFQIRGNVIALRSEQSSQILTQSQ